MLLSKIKKERLAEASISLAEIKATKKIILEELSVGNEDIKKKLMMQIGKHVRIYGQNLKPTFEKTEAKQLVSFVDNLVLNSEKCFRRLGDDVNDKEFYADLEVITAWHNLGLALAYFLKKIPNIIAGFEGFFAKAESAGPKSQDRLFEIFSTQEIRGMKERFDNALREPIRVLAVVSEDDFQDKKSDMRKSHGKFDDVTATIPEFIEMIRDSYNNKSERASKAGVPDVSLGVTDPIDLEANKIIDGLVDSTFESVNALLGNKKVRQEKKKGTMEQIKDYLAPPGDEGSPHTATSQYNDAMKKLSKEIKNEIGVDIPTDDLKKFVKDVLELIQNRSVNEADMLKMIEDSKK